MFEYSTIRPSTTFCQFFMPRKFPPIRYVCVYVCVCIHMHACVHVCVHMCQCVYVLRTYAISLEISLIAIYAFALKPGMYLVS